MIGQALSRVEDLLGHSLKRTLHVLLFASHKEACEALGREVHPSMLMAPFHSEDSALIVLQSPETHPRNGDRRRMRRHITHELGHVFAAEITASTKFLGDGNTNMRMSSWVDEGFAVTLSALINDEPDVLRKAEQRAREVCMSDDELSAAFDDLNSPRRQDAFAIATTRVSQEIARTSVPFVFRHLSSRFNR